MRVERADVATTPGLRMVRIGQQIGAEVARPRRGLLAEKPEDTIRNLADPQAFPWEVVVVIMEKIEPRLLDAKTFAGGLLSGRAYLYSYLEDSVICASSFVVGSSDRLRKYGDDPKAAHDLLMRDLENEAMRAAATTLSKAGPHLGDAGVRDAK